MYSRVELSGKIQSIFGPIEPQSLGVTLPHEHFLVDGRNWFVMPEAANERSLAVQPLSLDNLAWVRYHRYSHRDNLCLLDEELAARELLLFKLAGGKSVCEVTPKSSGRDPQAIARIASGVGLNVIMGTGYYTYSSYVPVVRNYLEEQTKENIAQEFVSEILEGIEGAGVYAGLLGEIGCSYPLHPLERKVLCAAGIAQRQTGAGLVVHPGAHEDEPLALLDILSKVGSDLSKVVMSHTSRTTRVHKNRCKILATGAYLAYDMFGLEGVLPLSAVPCDMPNDIGRVNEIVALIEEGFLNQILISHDVWNKISYRAWGGPGYAHILDHIVPLMRRKGISEEQIRVLMVENPRRLLTFK